MKKIIKMIPSKSCAHRAYICNGLSGNKTEIICPETSKDIEATRACLDGLRKAAEGGVALLPCGESGSTLRFLLPVVGALGIKAKLFLKGRLPERPLSPLREELTAHGMRIWSEEPGTILVEGQLLPGTFNLPGNVSSQFISGLLFALPLLEGDSRINVTGSMESKGYVDLTIDMLRQFGVGVECCDSGYLVPGGQSFMGPDSLEIEGDWSNAAFFAVLGAISTMCECTNLDVNSLQGDRAIVDIVKGFGGKIHLTESGFRGDEGILRAVDVDASAIPDLVPPIALLAAVSQGTTRIYNAGRLRIKESDRLRAISETLNELGGDVSETEDGLIIQGVSRLTGGEIFSFGDHRIVMMAAIASRVCSKPVIINGSEAVNKSYPGFFKELERLGLMDNLVLR